MGADGTWNMTMNTPMGAQEGTLTLVTEGDSLTGSMGGPQGELEIQEGKVEGDNLSWVVNMTQPMPMKVEATATIDGDTLSGEAKLGAFGTAEFTGTRA